MENLFLESPTFNEDKIYKNIQNVNSDLKEYIENFILPEYSLNDGGHNLDHVNYVLRRAFELINENINIDMLYTSVMFHDIACHIDRDNHEILSAKRAYEDEYLNKYFDNDQMIIIKNAIEDHRASLEYEPRNIYGKILSTSDRKVDVKLFLVASMSFDIKNHPEMSKEEVINSSYEFAIKKFGKNGYAISKTYISDGKYEKFISNLQYLIDNKNIYFDVAGLVYNEMKAKTK